MKGFNSLFVAAAICATSLFMSSCGSQKQVVYQPYPNYTTPQGQPIAQKTVTREEEEIDECEKKSMEMEGDLLRAYGSAIDLDKDFARQSAVANARAQMATDIKALVGNIYKNYRATTTRNNVSTASADRQQDIYQMAEEVISRTTVICSKRYKLGDGRYECSVCISMVGSAQSTIEKGIMSEDAKLGVRYDAEQFRKSYKEELEAYKASKSAE